MNRKEKLKAQIENGSNNLSHLAYFSPIYTTNLYFGASSYFGEQSRLYEFKTDFLKTEYNFFVHKRFKAIGRQLMI